MRENVGYTVDYQRNYDLLREFFQADAVEVKPNHSLVRLGQRQIARAPNKLTPQSRNVARIAAAKNLTVRYFAHAPLFDGHRIFRRPDGDWVLMPLEDDPLFRQLDNTLYVPERNIAHITDARNAGIDFQRVFIAHELPPNTPLPNGRVSAQSLAPPPSPVAMQQAQTHASRSREFWNMTERVMQKMAKVAFGITVGAVATAGVVTAAVAAPLVGLDPILFGVNLTDYRMPNQQPVGEWFYITHWFWE